MDWHARSSEEVLKNLKRSDKGLTELEAKSRLARYGKNTLRKFKKKSRFMVFLGQLNSFLVYILLLAAIVSALIGHITDAVIIGAIIILNAGIGYFQEYKAEEIIEKLKKSLRYKALVLRGGVRKEVDSRFLVPGDIVILSPGDRILADCRIIRSENLQANESVLTGESFPSEKSFKPLTKDIVLAERANMLYAGTNIVRGNATAIIVSTGKGTEFGKLAELVQTTKDEEMPLEKKLNKFSKQISIAILIFVAIAFIVGISIGFELVEMFLISVSLAIGAIPEGLPAIIAITLAVAIKQMHKSNTLIRRLPAAETLGRATVICTDKTGTLTEEELNVEKLYCGKMFSSKKLDKKDLMLTKLLRVGILCNNARDEEDGVLGDPTEVALIKVAKRFGLDKIKETEKNPRIKEYPFSSERKMMSIVRKNGNVKISYSKGAPGIILNRCTHELINGKARLLNDKRKNELRRVYRKMESEGLRVLGFAFKRVAKIDQSVAEEGLVLAGFQGMLDPPRKEVREAIKLAMDAGIKIKVITGDSALTTRAIASKIGLKGEIIESRELNRLPEDKWDEVVRTKTIFARVTPQQKLKIVDILKAQGEIVAVTGDGVNDILALKRADIGVSMGMRGSDVARDSSDMVLLDDNFASIVNAVKQGRRVFDNLKKSIKFLLSANAADIFIILFALVIGMPLPFLPLAILWMNLVTDSLPALALAVEPAEGEVMKRNPRSDGLLSGIWNWILIAGVLNFISVIWLFGWANGSFGVDVARTMAITTAIFFELFFAFSCKSKKSLFKTGILNNKMLIYAVLTSAALQFLAIYTLLGGVFGFVSLTGAQLGISIAAGLSGLVVFEAWKLIKARK